MFKNLVIYLKDIKLSHTIFAMPFALAGGLLSGLPMPSMLQWIKVIAAMVFARSFAMGANRLVDAKFDLDNPRTSGRAIPSGALPRESSRKMIITFAVLFIVVSFLLNYTAGILSPLVLAILWSYSYAKRFTWGCHFYLGFCLGLSPVAVNVALGAIPSLGILLLAAGIMFWVGGFDLLYSLQDIAFDKNNRLYSFPSRFGVKMTLLVSRMSFVVSMILLLVSGTMLGLSGIFRIGWCIIGALLFYEHWLIRDVDDYGHSPGISKAFFNTNAAVSIIFIVAVVADLIKFWG